MEITVVLKNYIIDLHYHHVYIELVLCVCM